MVVGDPAQAASGMRESVSAVAPGANERYQLGMSKNIASWLSDAVTRSPDAVAVRERGHEITYAELAGRAGGFARRLEGLGVGAGDRVAIIAPRGAAPAAVILAVQALGAVAVVVNDRLRVRQLEHILRDIEAKALVCSPEAMARSGVAPTMPAVVLDISEAPPSAAFVPVSRESGDLAHIIYTSGSTGLPRGVMHTHGSITAGVATVASYLGLRPDDRVAALIAFSSVYGLNQLYCTLSVGASLVIEQSVFAADTVASLRSEQVTVAAGVPPLWLQLLAVPGFSESMPELRQLQNAGGHLPVTAVKQLRAAQPQAALFLQYGMTETWRGTFLPPAEVDRQPGSMGRPIPGVEIVVVRDDGTVCADGETGELVQSGPTLASGYWRAPSSQGEVFRAHPLRPAERAVYSGDFVRRDSDGLLHYVGRHDRVIKTQGHRIGPDEVADVLFASGQVAEAMVAGEDDAERGQRVVAWVVLTTEGSLQQLRRFCRGELPLHMQPSRIEVRESLPRLASGKYDLAALRESAGG